MSAGKSVADILAGAKQTLQHAQDFSKSMPAHESPAPTPAAPKHEFSKASYGIAQEAKSAADGIKARSDMQSKLNQ